MPTNQLSDLLCQRDFMRLWFARVAGTGASQMLMGALAWQMYDLTSSAWDLGLVGLFQFVPALLLAFGNAERLLAVASIAFLAQYVGLLAERWFFFAQARHPQNLYYQAAS